MRHGVYSTYTNKGCRCDLCKGAAADYARELKDRKTQGDEVRLRRQKSKHGTWSRYSEVSW